MRSLRPSLSVRLTALENLDGLGNLKVVECVNVSENASLTDLSGLSGLRDNTCLEITENRSLTTLDGLEGITEVTWLTLYDNDALTNVSGLINLRNATDSILINDNSALTNLDGLGGLYPTGEHLSVHIMNNAALCGSDAWRFVDTLRDRGATVETAFDGVDYMFGNADC